MCVVVVMGFVEREPRRDGVGRCVRGYMSVMRALCCGGRGGAARCPADRGVFLLRMVVARWFGRRGSVFCRRCARGWLPGISIRLVDCPWCGVKLL